ncbi:MAG: hypothetical protein J7463_18215 [Roseiflexus sp.]|nr:hypothetical protein [Roseiflexus sp.]
MHLVVYDEIVRINNCGGKGDSEQTKSRDFATNVEFGAGVSAGYQSFVQGSLSAKYSDYRSASIRAYPKNWYTYRMSTEPTSKRTRARTPNNKTTTGFRISDELWAVLEPPLLSCIMNAHRHSGGRPRVSDRRCADAIF